MQHIIVVLVEDKPGVWPTEFHPFFAGVVLTLPHSPSAAPNNPGYHALRLRWRAMHAALKG